jgi:hypothetical protein
MVNRSRAPVIASLMMVAAGVAACSGAVHTGATSPPEGSPSADVAAAPSGTSSAPPASIPPVPSNPAPADGGAGPADSAAVAACASPDPDGTACGRSTNLHCQTGELDCACTFAGQSGPDQGHYTCRHQKAETLTQAVAGVLTFACQPPRPGENTLDGTASITFDDRKGSVAVPFALQGINVRLDATYTFSAAARATSGAAGPVVAQPGQLAEDTRAFGGGAVYDVPAHWANASGVDVCTYCGRFLGAELVANVMGQTFTVDAPNIALSCTR